MPRSAPLLFSSGIRGCATRRNFSVRASRTSIGTIACSSYPTARLIVAEGSCHSVIAALELLKDRCGERRQGWIFKAFSASGHLTTVDRKFRQARSEAGLPQKLVLYCGRHDYGTRVLQGTGNLAVVMRAMGHGSPPTAMKYQHAELEQVRRVLNGTNSHHDPEQGLSGKFYDTVTKQ
jgi:site-specific recombinase XerD